MARMVITVRVVVSHPEAGEYNHAAYGEAYMEHVQRTINHHYLVTGQNDKFHIESTEVVAYEVQE